MIGWGDIYKVVVAMAPLYVAMILGYGSIRWWHMFKPDHCDAINRFNCFFILPFFTFHFIAQVDPYTMNYLFVASDVVAKAMVVVALVIWANFVKNGGLDWSITTFSLSTLNNTLVVGVPLMQAMYGRLGYDLVLQAAAMQALLWLTMLLFGLEFRRTRLGQISAAADNARPEMGTDLEGNPKEAAAAGETPAAPTNIGPSYTAMMKSVCLRLAKNPNTYACFLGLIWAIITKGWHFTMPSIIDDSIMIMAKGGSGIAMFSTGLFMALQDRIISCGWTLTVYGLVLRFLIGPATSAIGAILLRLHGDVLKIVIVQSALPQAVTTFIFAKEYGLHADVLSTAIIIGTILSLPVMIGYYVILELLP
ncbi:PREDICTED: auxin efflux carrier component 5-like [Ipomoea nil]|uniref:auxin efflux carrier component 5-like n=1 Tax=Ipomoea nil TaxID=35883 RepID=UPI000901D544|nr:PREDICTED: auxin efflux carrier component 5-like [Ipomoea nil]XP_019185867.1 PREDICTED: auxin efflux carrier component 5-like [Ipomoea nil]